MTPPNPHDLFIRKIFSQKEESIAFLETALSPNISKLLDFSKLEHTKESYIGEEYKESRTDILYRIPLKSGSEIYIYILFEHKSYYDPNIFTQLLRYLSEIYQWQRKNFGKYQVVLPFVFYHGKRGWDLGIQFLDLFQLSQDERFLSEYIPNFALHLYQLMPDSEDFSTDILSLKLYLRILRNIRTEPDLFIHALQKTTKDLSEEKTAWKKLEILRTILEYMDKARMDAEKYYDVEFYKGVEEEYMTFLEKSVSISSTIDRKIHCKLLK
jgi:predicted transposase/invertase (TIGR01784 family)